DPDTDLTTFTMLTPGDVDETRLVLLAGAAVGMEVPAVSVAGLTASVQGRWDRPEVEYEADGTQTDFAYEFPILDTAEIAVDLNNAPLDPGTWLGEHPDEGIVRITAVADGSPLPDDTGVRIYRTRKDKHHVGRRVR